MKVLLFDLGGVVINWTGLQEMQKLLGNHFSLEEIRQKMVTNPMLKKLETGNCTAEAFAHSFVMDFELPFSAQEFLPLYASWAGKPYTGVLDRLEELRKQYRLVCISNTNPIHWEYLTTEIGISEVFDACFASHLLHCSKPDPRMYHLVLKALDTVPDNVCFFDDAFENIDAAQNLGIKTCHVDASIGVLPYLQNFEFS